MSLFKNAGLSVTKGAASLWWAAFLCYAEIARKGRESLPSAFVVLLTL